MQLVGIADKTPAEGGVNIQLRLSAGESVNSDGAGRANALVVRFYQLRDTSQFLSLPRDAFEAANGTPEALKEEWLGSKEQLLMPGQQYRLAETTVAQARYLGVVMLFQSTKPARWRVAIPVDALDGKLLDIAVHRCSFTVSQGLADKDLALALGRAGSASCG